MDAQNRSAVNWKLTLSYDGTLFHGWQVQPNCATVQGELAAAIKRITTENVLPQGSGRTDAGVHAICQVASFFLHAPIPAPNLLRALNRILPPSIRARSVEVVGPQFHARHSALSKTYEYRIYRGENCSPFLAPYVYAMNWPLNVQAMQAAAVAIRGVHDFTSFAATDPDWTQRQTAGTHSNIRAIYESVWKSAQTNDGELLTFRIRGSGFLHHMVRNLVGTFLDVGRGNIPAARLPEILAARSRQAAGPTAPARGLFLLSVDY